MKNFPRQKKLSFFKIASVLIIGGSLVAGCAGPMPQQVIDQQKAADPGLPTYQCRRAEMPISLDGKLDDAAWKAAPLSANFFRKRVQVRTLPPDLHTRMKILYDDTALYIGIVCQDTDIWSTFNYRDAPVFNEEAVVVHLDPRGNGRDYYGFYVNPLNALLDMRRPDGTPEMKRSIWLDCTRWNAGGIEHAVAVDGTVNDRADVDQSWTVEIKVPFDALGVVPRPGDTWRFQIGRYTRPAMGGVVISAYSDSIVLYAPQDFGYLEFD